VAALNCVLAQRLVRVICERCRQPAEVDAQLLEDSNLTMADLDGATLYEGAGCDECRGTGFHGRTVIAELLDLSDEVREMILDRRPSSEIKRQAAAEGMAFLRDSALDRVRAGVTTLQEINKVTFVG